jgi:hypothetical protein
MASFNTYFSISKKINHPKTSWLGNTLLQALKKNSDNAGKGVL